MSDAAEIAAEQRQQSAAASMRARFNPAALSPQDALSWRLFDRSAKRSATLFPYRHLGFVFDQMNGAQSQLPAFLINIHSVANAAQAEAYVSRLAGVGPAMDQLIAESHARAERGVTPPKWVYPYVIDDIDNLLKAGTKNAVLDDFREKVAKLELTAAEKADLERRAVAAWTGSAVPAYRRLHAEMVRQQAQAAPPMASREFPDVRFISRAAPINDDATLTPTRSRSRPQGNGALHGEMGRS